MKRGDVLAWFEANPGEHTAEEVVEAFGLVWRECKPFRNKIASLAHTGHLSAKGPRPKRYAFAKPLTPPDEHIRRAVTASADKRRLPDDERAERERAWRRERMARPGVRERIREMQRLARLRNGRTKGRATLTDEQRKEQRRQRQAAWRARKAAERVPTPKPPKAPKPKPAKPVKVAKRPQAMKQAIAVAAEQKGAPKVELAVTPVLPDSTAWLVANEGKTDAHGRPLVERLPINAPWRATEGPVAQKNRARSKEWNTGVSARRA